MPVGAPRSGTNCVGGIKRVLFRRRDLLERHDVVVGLVYFVQEVLERVILVHGENQGEPKQEGDR